MRTLIEKELRENLRWLWVGLALIGSLVWYATPKTLVANGESAETLIASPMLLGASLFALGLGVMQSFADLRTAGPHAAENDKPSFDPIRLNISTAFLRNLSCPSCAPAISVFAQCSIVICFEAQI